MSSTHFGHLTSPIVNLSMFGVSEYYFPVHTIVVEWYRLRALYFTHITSLIL